MGLGLSISYQIVVEKYGGVLKCISEPVQSIKFGLKSPFTKDCWNRGC
jgi:two-component system NtrC family sensor kinase